MTSKWEPYVVLSRLPSSSHSRGDRGVRVLRLEGDFYAHLADAQATAKHIEETSRKVTFIAQVLGDDLGKRIKELEDEKVEFLAYAGCSSFPEVVARMDSLAYHAQAARNELDAWREKETP